MNLIYNTSEIELNKYNKKTSRAAILLFLRITALLFRFNIVDKKIHAFYANITFNLREIRFYFNIEGNHDVIVIDYHYKSLGFLCILYKLTSI